MALGFQISGATIKITWEYLCFLFCADFHRLFENFKIWSRNGIGVEAGSLQLLWRHRHMWVSPLCSFPITTNPMNWNELSFIRWKLQVAWGVGVPAVWFTRMLRFSLKQHSICFIIILVLKILTIVCSLLWFEKPGPHLNLTQIHITDTLIPTLT